MKFDEFCRAHGLLITFARTNAKPVRCATKCAPREKKGWYIWDGLRGACGIWHGLDNGAQVYTPDSEVKPLTPTDFARIKARCEAVEREKREGQAKAAEKAQIILARAEMRSHAYLQRKGFPSLVPTLMDGKVMLVTMWQGRKLVNVQSIAEDGKKLFLADGEVIGARHCLGDVGTAILCEGYATGLSIAAAIKASKSRAHCVVCFSAGNLVAVAETLRDAVVIADNDRHKNSTGELAAQKTGFRYWMPPTPGHDANDFHRAHGLFALAMEVKQLLMIRKKADER